MRASKHPYPKEARLRRQPQFRRVLAHGEVFPGRQALVRRVANDTGAARLGLSTPRAYGGAVRRNRFRRLAREAFRALRGQLGAYDYLVSPRRHLREPTLEGLREDLGRTRTAAPAPAQPRRPRRRKG